MSGSAGSGGPQSDLTAAHTLKDDVYRTRSAAVKGAAAPPGLGQAGAAAEPGPAAVHSHTTDTDLSLTLPITETDSGDTAHVISGRPRKIASEVTLSRAISVLAKSEKPRKCLARIFMEHSAGSRLYAPVRQSI